MTYSYYTVIPVRTYSHNKVMLLYGVTNTVHIVTILYRKTEF